LTRRSLQALSVGVIALSLVVMGAGFPARSVPPKQWAKSVCTAVGDWANGAQTGAQTLQTKTTGSDTSIPKIKKALVSYLSATASATSTVGDKLEHAGTPKTSKGTQAAKGLRDGFARIHTAVDHFKHDAQKVSTTNPAAALAALKKLQTKINTQFESLNATFGNLGKYDPDHKIEKAFKATPACKALNG
jgi:hypothetical protein